MKQLRTKRQRCTREPTGPFVTGCCDIMAGAGRDGAFMRLFYPSFTKNKEQEISAYPLAKWYLGTNYTKGLAKFVLPMAAPLFNVVADFILRDALMPSLWEAPVLEGKFPVVVFSHGLGANRSLYSSICSDVASHGFIVAAIEHRDQSACATFTVNEDGSKEWISFKSVIMDNSQFDFRLEQIKQRASECSRVLDVLIRLNNGQLEHSAVPCGIPLASFKGALDTEQVTIAGQSFGGATAILSLSRDKRFKAGVALDPWMFPLAGFEGSKKSPSPSEIAELKGLNDSIEQPILFVLMELFQSPKNLQVINKFDKKRNQIWTIRGAMHTNQTDVAVLLRNHWRVLQLLAWSGRALIPAERVYALNNKLMINFICDQLAIENPLRSQYEKTLQEHSKTAVQKALGKARLMLGWDKKRTTA